MRLLFAAAWICICPLCLLGGETKGRSAAPVFNGQEYTDLEKWADRNHFQFVISKKDKDEEIHLTNRWANVVFRTKSQRIELNGICLFLAFPLALHQGTVYIAQNDIDRALNPILFPPKGKPRPRIETIAISAGHGGKDSGNQVGTHQEKKYTLLLATQVNELVGRAGLKSVLIRDSDKFVELDDKPKIAKRGKADLFLELHYNSAGPGNTESRGVEVYCLSPSGANSTNGGSEQYGGSLAGNKHDGKNILLAYEIQRSLVDSAGLADRGVRRARFAVLRDTEMPAVLIEAGFMSHPEEMRTIQDPTHRRQTAQAIVDGVLAYKRLLER